MKPHKHAELIKAWADGAEIECYFNGLKKWDSVSEPSWSDDFEYRIKSGAKCGICASTTQQTNDGCGNCHACLVGVMENGYPVTMQRMIVCPDCGNKRCPKASNHRHQCTGSNEPNQRGSIYTTHTNKAIK